MEHSAKFDSVEIFRFEIPCQFMLAAEFRTVGYPRVMPRSSAAPIGATVPA